MRQHWFLAILATEVIIGTGRFARAEPTQQPDIGEDQLAVFKLQRGFYFSTDVGVFMTLGGKRGYSDVEPFMAVKGGYDLNDYFSVQAFVSTAFASGNPVSDANEPSRGIASYGLYNFGAEVISAIRPTQRFAIEPKIGAGFTRINPELLSEESRSDTLAAFTPLIEGGVDLKYLTLLTDFSAGLALTGYYIVGPRVPALSVAGVLRYTF